MAPKRAPKEESVERRFERLIPKGDDLQLILLKGHLLAEELMVRVLGAHLGSSTRIAEARLTFYQKLCLTRALLDVPGLQYWDFLQALNAARNYLVHNADPTDLRERLATVFRDSFDAGYRKPKRVATQARHLREATGSVCGFLYGVSISMDATRRKVGPRVGPA